MQLFSKNISIILLGILTMATACNKSNLENTKIDIENIDFNTTLDSILQSDKYIYLSQSSVSNTPLYYTYNTDTLRYGKVNLFEEEANIIYNRKPEQLDDVFDVNENSNRIDLYLSDNKKSIVGIGLIIYNTKTVKNLLSYLKVQPTSNLTIWENNNKTYILYLEQWAIDEQEMKLVSLSIAETGSSLESLFLDYYKQ